MELIETLTKELGVKQEQARGGVRILFQIVKETLGEEDFYKVARLLPDLEEMATRVPGNGCVEGGLARIDFNQDAWARDEKPGTPGGRIPESWVGLHHGQ
jgi:hypothetical protein